MSSAKAVLIQANQDPENPDLVTCVVKMITIPHDDVLKTLQDHVGGYIEYVPTDPSLDIVVDEESKVKGRPLNVAATRIWAENHDPYQCVPHGDYVAGHAVIVGPPDEDGWITDLPDAIREQFRVAAVNPEAE